LFPVFFSLKATLLILLAAAAGAGIVPPWPFHRRLLRSEKDKVMAMLNALPLRSLIPFAHYGKIEKPTSPGTNIAYVQIG
jgi:hypothetical protein